MSTNKTVTQEPDSPDALEDRTQQIGHELWDHLERSTPSIFERRWWDDRILSWAMSDESVKVQMFRFVDVLPMLRSHDSITRHLQEYFEEVRQHLPWAMRLMTDSASSNSLLSRALAYNARTNATSMAKRFIAGTNSVEVLESVERLRESGFGCILDLLGEAVISESEADNYQNAYLTLLNEVAEDAGSWPTVSQVDHDNLGEVPRIQLSLKLSSLYSQFQPADTEGTAEAVKERLRPVLQAAQEKDAYIHIDMESYFCKDLTLAIFKEVLMEDEFRQMDQVGIVIQAYLRDAEEDLEDLLEWVKERGTPVAIRLVKGAYWDYEKIHAEAHGWPIPVFLMKWESDANFEKLSGYLLEHRDWLRPQFGTHNMRSIANIIAMAEAREIPKTAYEFQMLYGMAGEIGQILIEQNHRVRIYAPFGELLPGMSYLVRRLLENTSNDSFLRQSLRENIDVESLFMNPTEVGKTMTPPEEFVPVFQNEPFSDFSLEEVREQMEAALEDISNYMGEEYPVVINGRIQEPHEMLLSRNPSNSSQIVGRVASATPDQAEEAIDAARRAFKEWSGIEAKYRSEYLELIANEMRDRRFELAAWMVYECGKPWVEADADVAEAIDFCNYYAEQMRFLGEPRHRDVPGEENSYYYRARGVVVVISPWNFPLAILTGMTVAALVSGNTVIMKPAEQSSVIAAKLMEIFSNAGIPSGVVNYLPGNGEDIGPVLVNSPDVDMVTFTGSRPVGLEINRSASDTDQRQHSVRKIIAEMGGKNAIIVDADADLDEAVQGVVQSAFSYAGQKCSACSRVIVMEDVYDQFLERLVEAAGSLVVGAAEHPATTVGPVIDKAALDRINEYIELAYEEGDVVLATDVSELEGEGYYVGPHIIENVASESRLAQEEIFGPVLVVFKVQKLNEAFEIANNTDYALTGGMYSRSPKNLQQARLKMICGNLYLNRGITGALVDRQPFGGFRMSGIGTKAGGPDYLHQFLIPINVTENTMRRGFAPNATDPNSVSSDTTSSENEDATGEV
ncbi:1-pyrroline-5-carboxylate dehydrogenase 1 [Polystyrenella longa]|uniref:L-glutamate gamma-semialdehyde dehydrogenase n=1 Tax=Polystyrenella longa TaxID=2528007 RepID=A0A518CKM5_9PLAN|nr:L-glutamate gamma-semialdehyde dehydrogenase [Polystyrenella longa]QDU79780.1 1-pyrroline-5-carboxylate dehydrogenase 1 [Polystyrenella longa]